MSRLFWFHAAMQTTPLGALLANQHWALIHEGLHGRLPRWQTWVLCALFGSPASARRYHHLKHHRDNRVRERVDELPWYTYYPQLLGGLYVLEVMLCLTRRDGPVILLIQAALLWAWGWWYVGALCVRALLISLMDYAYHYKGALDVWQGYDLDAGRLGHKYLLGFAYHGAHHRRPWIAGPALTAPHTDGPLWRAVLRQLMRWKA
jgi:hypothetical protein